MIVKLAPHDYAEATRIAHIRHDHKTGVVNTRRVFGAGSSLEHDYFGVLAEIAVAKAFGVEVDERELPCGDDGVDLELGDRTVQVKYSSHKRGHLIFMSSDDFGADIAVLVVPHDDDSVRIAGWLTRAEFEDRMEVKDFGYGKRVCVGQDDLMPAWLLEGLGATAV